VIVFNSILFRVRIFVSSLFAFDVSITNFLSYSEQFSIIQIWKDSSLDFAYFMKDKMNWPLP
jgi:hypothetical protein